MIPVTINGKHYKSISAACREYNVSEDTITRRVKEGISLEEAFYSYSNGKEVVVEGVTYSSISSACEAYGIDCALVYKRMRGSTMTIDEMFTKPRQTKYQSPPLKNRSKKEIVINGVHYSSQKEAIVSLNLKEKKIYDCARRQSISVEDAILKYLNNEVQGRNPIQLIVDGVEYLSLEDASRKLGVTVNTLKNYQKKYDSSLEDAIRYYKKNGTYSERVVIIKGKQFRNFKEACKHFEIPYNVAKKLLEHPNCSHEEAVVHCLAKKEKEEQEKLIAEYCISHDLDYRGTADFYEMPYAKVYSLVKKYTPTKSRKTKIIKIEGREFSNMTEACKYFNISRTSVYERMGRLKVSREEAITYYINKQKSKITPP